MPYRGRLAPTPTGDMHVGHARTYMVAFTRARAAGGTLALRMEDLAWLGITWDGEVTWQSARRDTYLAAWRRLRDAGLVYPSTVSRRELRDAAHAPHEDEEEAEPLFPAALRPPPGTGRDVASPAGTTWRFRVPDGTTIAFTDALQGERRYVAGVDIGDFVVWRRDDVPAYELAVVADDVAMGITEVVRGADLLRSTARQLLLHAALGATPPAWCHVPLVRDAAGRRLAKRDDALSIRTLRARGLSPGEVLSMADASV